MNDIITLNSRGGTKNYLKKMKKADGSDSKTYILKSDGPYLRVGWMDEKHEFVDPSGGPMIVEGHKLKEADAIVKSIDYIAGTGYLITFE